MKFLLTMVMLCLPLSACTTKAKVESLEHDICQEYDWGKVEQLVSPYLDDFLMTALTMQGQNANYRTSEAASEAIAAVNDEKVRAILARLIAENCD